jgi:hypothetical protein
MKGLGCSPATSALDLLRKCIRGGDSGGSDSRRMLRESDLVAHPLELLDETPLVDTLLLNEGGRPPGERARIKIAKLLFQREIVRVEPQNERVGTRANQASRGWESFAVGPTIAIPSATLQPFIANELEASRVMEHWMNSKYFARSITFIRSIRSLRLLRPGRHEILGAAIGLRH